MQDVTVMFTSGPMRERRFEFEVGRVVIGRLPGDGGLELKGADTSVSREHAVLEEADGDIELCNLSPNGTTVNGKLVLDRVKVLPGAKVSIGDQHAFELAWTSFETRIDDAVARKAAKATKKGPLSSPVVRVVLGVYLAGIVGVALWLGVFADADAIAADDWPGLESAYQAYGPADLTEEERESRLVRARTLVRELRALRTQGIEQGTGSICREMMRIDRDSQSPFYLYGAKCLGAQ